MGNRNGGPAGVPSPRSSVPVHRHPAQGVAMNLLSMGAAYGVIVAIYQWGWLASIFGVNRTGPIDPWIPLMMFTIVFGLSMDYEVFLLSRMREEWVRTGDNAK